MELILYYILCPLCIGLIIALFVAYESTRRANDKTEAVSAELLKLNEKLKKEAEDFKHTARQLSAYYDERVERKEKEIVKVELSHGEWKAFAIYCAKALDRLHPGWIEKRLAGEPEYELVIEHPPTGTAAVKRATPTKRASEKKSLADPQNQPPPEEWTE